MDRAEFLNRLEAQLLDVPQAEREEALQYYEDYLNDAGDAGDFDILQELGTPEDCGRIAAPLASAAMVHRAAAAVRLAKIGRTAAAAVSPATVVIFPKTATSTGSRRRKSCSG